MNTNKLFLSLAAASLTGGTLLGAAFTIDDFDTFVSPGLGTVGLDIDQNGPGTSTDGAGDILPAADTSLVGTVTRTASLTVTSGGGGANVSNASSVLGYSNDFGVQSATTLTYTLSSPANLNVGDRFTLQLVSSDAAIQYVVSVYDGVNTSTKNGFLPAVPSFFDLLFTSFTGSANFGNVQTITIALNTTTAFGSDAAIDAFGLNLTDVPEPSTYAAVGFMGLVAFGAYRRARK